jgi:hypothetical protein
VARRDPTGASPEPVWPERLVRPTGRAILLYLDLFVWIQLTKARLGHRSGEASGEALSLLRTLTSAGIVRVPLSDALYGEMHVITNPRQRAEVAETMVEISSTEYLLGRPTVMALEVDTMVKKVLRTATLFYPDHVELVGRGVHHTFGLRGTVNVYDQDDNQVTDATRARDPERWDRVLAQATAEAELAALAGPTDDQLPELRTRGYAPEIPMATNRRRYEQEAEQAIRFATTAASLRRGRLRDGVCAREFLIEMNNAVSIVSNRYGTSLTSYLERNIQNARDFIRGMPSADTSVSIKTVFFQDPNHAWTTNDINDIDAMSVAVPYCDVVVADAAVRNALIREGLHDRYNTVLPKGLPGLTEHLRELAASATDDTPRTPQDQASGVAQPTAWANFDN